jgi:Protein kinase domain/Calx-beta domain
MSEQTHIERISSRVTARARAEPAIVRSAQRTTAHADAGPPIGTVLAARYELLAFMEHGRHGPTYRARDKALSPADGSADYTVRLCLLRPGPHLPRLLDKIEQFVAEPQAWSHPGLLRLLNFGRDDAGYFAVTELIDGLTLRALLEENAPAPLSLEETRAVLNHVGDALKYAHAKGAVHGAVRPDNVLLTLDYGVKLLDLWPLREQRSSPWFVEDIEIGATREGDPRDDVYGVACLAYEMLAGKHPFNANSALEAFRSGLAPAPIAGLAPEQWQALRRGLALHRERRLGSLAELLIGLGVTGRERLRGSEPDPLTPAAPIEPPRRARPQRAASPILTAPRRRPGAHAPPAPRPRGRLRTALLIALLALLAGGEYLQHDELQARATDLIAQADGWRQVVVAAANSAVAARDTRAAVSANDVAPPARATELPAPASAEPDGAPVAQPPDPAEPPPATETVAAVEPKDADPAATNQVAVPPATPQASPTPSFGAAQIIVREGDLAARITISRGDASAPATAVWWTVGGTALPDEDFVDRGAVVERFKVGELSRVIFVPLIADSVRENRESFFIYLGSGSERTARSAPGARLEVVIVDDDS